jgi:MFS family permease
LKKISRKNTFLIIDGIGLVFSLICAIENLELLIIARFILGIVTGINSAVIPIYLKEIVPLHLTGSFGVFFMTLCNIGNIFAFLWGLGYSSDPKASDTLWRYAFAFPSIFYLIRFVIILSCFNFDSPFYYLMKGD